MCLYPRLIKNPKYKPNKKNGGIAPVCIDNRVMAVPIGCQKCIECKKQKARDWQVRLKEEIRESKNGKFVTLTFSNESIKELEKETTQKGYDKDNEIATIAIRRYLERWRKKYKKSIRHWLVTEIGQNGTENIHMHGIIWTDEKNEEISKIWKYGGITIGKRLYINGKAINNNTEGYVNDKTITYISKYMFKTDIKHKEYSAKILNSPGIGGGYEKRMDAKKNKYREGETKETYTGRNGQEQKLPIYYRNKIYTEEEKEKLWIEKIDKQERYVLGRKIDISKNEEQYYKALKTAREKNDRLGYGNDRKNWIRKEYEDSTREIRIETRIKAAEKKEKRH
jgi:hypothetical protein